MHVLASWPGIYGHSDLPMLQAFKGGQIEKTKIEAAGTSSLLIIGDHLIECLSSIILILVLVRGLVVFQI